MGVALGVELMAQGAELAGHLNRTAESRRQAAQRLGVPAATDLHSLAARKPELWLLTVPDASLPEVVDTLFPLIEPGQYVAHTSGATSVSVLEPCAAQGAVTLAFHPLQTVTASPAPELFRGVSIAVTPGTAGAWEAGLRLAELLGARPFPLRDEDRALYHVAGVIASNYVVTLAWLARQLFQRVGIPADGALEALLPLTTRAVENLREVGIPQALTGPLARGDLATIARHLSALEREAPEALPVYRALGGATVGLLTEHELLPAATLSELKQILAPLTPPDPSNSSTPPKGTR